MVYYLIIIGVIEFILVSIYLIFGIKNQKLIDKRNFLYFIPVFILNILIYNVGYYYSNNEIGVFSFMSSLTYSLKAFAFDYTITNIKPLIDSNIVFTVELVICQLIAGISTLSSILGFFKIAIYNSYYVLKKLFNKELDIVIGFSRDSLKYMESNPDAIMVIDSIEHKNTAEENKMLFLKGYNYINKQITPGLINRLIRLAKGNVNIIYFNDYFEYSKIYNLVDKTKARKSKTVIYRVQTNSENKTFLNDQFSEYARKHNNVMASCFDTHELMAIDFNKKYNLAEFIDQKCFEDGALNNNININCYFLGFGKTNKELFKNVVMNNQFVKWNGGKLEAYPVNYIIYDYEIQKTQSSIIHFINGYDELFNGSKLPKPERIANVKVVNKNVTGDGLVEFVSSIKNEENLYNFFFVSLQKSFDNSAIVNELKRIAVKNAVFFYKVHGDKETVMSTSNILPYGFKNDIINHDTICSNEDYGFAAITSEKYRELSGNNEKFFELNIMEKLSNLYQNMSIRFKLNIVGLDISNNKKEAISEEEYRKILKVDSLTEYNDYFEDFPINTLVYQEHLRWNCYYLLNGFKPMSIDDVKFNGSKVVHKDMANKVHACITTVKGLDMLHKYEVELYQASGINMSLSDVETYKYDIQTLRDLPQILKKFGLYIVKKN